MKFISFFICALAFNPSVGGFTPSVSIPVITRDTSLQMAKDNVQYGENSRKFRRTFYTQPDWVKHRNSDRFLRNIRTTFDSGVVRQVAKETSIIGLVALCVVLFNNLLVTGWDDCNGVHHAAILFLPPEGLIRTLSIPVVSLQVASPALGLLLVFRTNTAYFRWNEARTAWGSIINNSRTVMRLGCSWIEPEIFPMNAALEAKEKAQLERLRDAVWSFSRSLQRHLLSAEEDEEAYVNAVSKKLPPSYAKDLIYVRHRPTRALQEVNFALRDMPLEVRHQMEVEKAVTELCNALGACERLFGSPVPTFYTHHTARFLGFWMLGMPLGLWDSFGYSWNHWGVIPASMTVAFFLFGIEELSVQLEEPFSILPMEKMVGGIEQVVGEHVDWHFEDVKRIESVPNSFAAKQRELEAI
mmetsp:Transcript_48241/g.71487  ORF Transcript_48241/g.71487 Transcript_48241/m.71487 type:complete len:413 (-) Transcript_48241:222-1460(-)|eukprot:CAMPEP_0195509798 /NCGR_PEP_ID=MMETSP0794_2-20130614/2632_1 /TAXON_ID=515487 /ORGANISM="Stephanopyxis turris, Strain CCMP 815" /LENGTH=412 /DNA_ID=CAMNT_0040637103 /DNA_START=215 /DNA_END=1453 /DNA_ORIENTATION=+